MEVLWRWKEKRRRRKRGEKKKKKWRKEKKFSRRSYTRKGGWRGWTKVGRKREREDREGGGKGTTMRIYVICVYDLNNCLHNITGGGWSAREQATPFIMEL